MSANVVAVTGARGFIGRELIRTLGAQRCDVRPIVRRARGSHDVAVGDIGRATGWEHALSGVEIVVHLAARTHVRPDERSETVEAFRAVNVYGTRRLAEQAVACGVRRFVYVSSIKVNGERTAHGVQFRNSDTPGPRDAYGRSKWEAEQALHEVAARSGMEIVIVRPPLVYGPGAKANFARLVELVRAGVPLPFAAVRNRRSLIFLDNLVDVLVRCVHHPLAAGETFLVSDDEDLSTPTLVRRLASAMERTARLFPVPVALLRAGGSLVGRADMIERLVSSLQVDIRHTCSTLDWKPPISIDIGLRRSVQGL